MTRRSLLKSLLSYLSLAALFSFIYPAYKYLSPANIFARKKPFTIKKKEIPEGEAKDVIVNSNPVIIINNPSQGFIALSRVCTHLGCLVDYDKSRSRLVCPCHAAQFDIDGKVISGPAPKPLTRFALTIEGDSVIIS